MPEPSTQELIDAAMRAVNDPGQFVERYGLRHTHLETGCGCAGGFETLNNWQRRALALAFEPLLDESRSRPPREFHVDWPAHTADGHVCDYCGCWNPTGQPCKYGPHLEDE